MVYHTSVPHTQKNVIVYHVVHKEALAGLVLKIDVNKQNTANEVLWGDKHGIRLVNDATACPRRRRAPSHFTACPDEGDITNKTIRKGAPKQPFQTSKLSILSLQESSVVAWVRVEVVTASKDVPSSPKILL
jgi:hypothetical protein